VLDEVIARLESENTTTDAVIVIDEIANLKESSDKIRNKN
jgi:hypothetical protein